MKKIIGHKYFWHVVIAIVVIISIYIYINKKKKELEVNELIKLIGDTSTDASVSNPAIAKKEVETNFINLKSWNPSVYINRKGKQFVYPDKEADKQAKIIFDSKGNFYDNEDDVVSIIKKQSNPYMLSKLSMRFGQTYKKSLPLYIKEFVDKDNNLEQIFNHVKSLDKMIK